MHIILFVVGYLLFIGAWKYVKKWIEDRRSDEEWRRHLAEIREERRRLGK